MSTTCQIDQTQFVTGLTQSQVRRLRNEFIRCHTTRRRVLSDYRQAIAGRLDFLAAISAQQLCTDPNCILSYLLKASGAISPQCRPTLEEVLDLSSSISIANPIPEPVQVWAAPRTE